MSKQVWVERVKHDRYSQERESQWLLGTVVGEQELKRYKEHITMADTMSGELFWIEKRYLVEAGDETFEVWESDCYPPSKGKP